MIVCSIFQQLFTTSFNVVVPIAQTEQSFDTFSLKESVSLLVSSFYFFFQPQ